MSIHTELVKIEERKISTEKAANFIYSDLHGAQSIFVGRVRNENNGKKVKAVTYDVHEQMVIKSFKSICNTAKNKIDSNSRIFLEHAIGYVPQGEISIIIAVACSHRAEAYDLSRYIIEEIKKKSPIWKKEHYNNKDGEWLKGNPIQTN